MRMKDDQILRLAADVLADLSSAGLITLSKERSLVVAGIREAIDADLKAEQNLERDAERLLEETLRATKGGGLGIDRHKMLRMIKERLAKERKIVL